MQKDIPMTDIIYIQKNQLIPATVQILQKTQNPIIYEQEEETYGEKFIETVLGNPGDILPQNSILKSSETIMCSIVKFSSYNKQKYKKLVSYPYQNSQLQKTILKCNFLQTILYISTVAILTTISYYEYRLNTNNIEWQNEQTGLSLIFSRIGQYIVYGYYFYPMNILQGINKVRGINNILYSVNKNVRDKDHKICKFNDVQGYEKLIEENIYSIDAECLIDQYSFNYQIDNLQDLLMILTSLKGYIDNEVNTLKYPEKLIIKQIKDLKIQILNQKLIIFEFQGKEYKAEISQNFNTKTIQLYNEEEVVLKLQFQTSIQTSINKTKLRFYVQDEEKSFILNKNIKQKTLLALKYLQQEKQLYIYGNLDALSFIQQRIFQFDENLSNKIIFTNKIQNNKVNVTNQKCNFCDQINILVVQDQDDFEAINTANIAVSSIYQIYKLLIYKNTIKLRLKYFIQSSYYKNNILIFTNYLYQYYTQYTMQINTESFILLVYTTFLTFSQQVTCYLQVFEDNKEIKMFNMWNYIGQLILSLFNSFVYMTIIYLIFRQSLLILSDLRSLYVFVINGLIFSFLVEQLIRQTHYSLITGIGTAFTFLIAYFMEVGATLGIFGDLGSNTLSQMYTPQGTLISCNN